MIDYQHPSIAHLRNDVNAYMHQRHRAKQRGIDFLLSFDEWYQWWQGTGHYHERGCRRGQYVMARNGDKGPYALDNIKCITHEENRAEAYADPAYREAMLKENRNKTSKNALRNKVLTSLESKQAPTGLPELTKRPKTKFADLPIEEQQRIKSEAAKRAYETRVANGNLLKPSKGHKKGSTENYKGRTPWNKGKTLGPRDPETVEYIAECVRNALATKRDGQ